MAKPENPAEASAARPPRPVQRVRFDALAEHALAEGGLLEEQLANAHAGHAFDPAALDSAVFDPAAFDPAAFDPARNLETPDGFLAEDGFDAEGAHAEGDSGARHSFAEDDGLDDDAGRGDDAARVAAAAARNPNVEPRPGLAWARRHVPGSWTPEPPNGSANGSVSASRVPKLPVANLERPSTSRVELTPSPVPRVALAPATGALDISLVPGPHTIGSRNLPTLAAQHLLGRRAPRRPAPAVTVPPPSSRESRSAFTLARDVRSSKGEIVLGLTIGLGVSLLLAGLGQAYLRGDVIADGSSDPAQLESVTLSARPDVAPAAGVAPAGIPPAGIPPAGIPPAGSAPQAPSNGSGVPASGAASPAASGDAAPGARTGVADARTAPRDAVARDAVLLARATVGKRTERTPQRSTLARAARPRPARRADSGSASSAVDSSATHPPAVVPRTVASSGAVSPAAVSPGALAAPSEPPPAEPPRAPALTPAESAGLGLDLSL
jgi:hypothetical protein